MVAATPSINPFQSTLPVRGATNACAFCDNECKISIHAPRAGSDPELKLLHHIANISIHAPRAGSDDVCAIIHRIQYQFQSTLPVRGATIRIVSGPLIGKISIHAPRAGSDTLTPEATIEPTDFNPRSPCGERRDAAQEHEVEMLFQSTLPVRGATKDPPCGNARSVYFNPRSPCGERPVAGRRWMGRRNISIHAPRAGSDSRPSCCRYRQWHFNPRSPCGERLSSVMLPV